MSLRLRALCALHPATVGINPTARLGFSRFGHIPVPDLFFFSRFARSGKARGKELAEMLDRVEEWKKGFWILDFGFWILDFGFWI
jgi:hypothetical protein